jgi:hypothetical protein
LGRTETTASIQEDCQQIRGDKSQSQMIRIRTSSLRKGRAEAEGRVAMSIHTSTSNPQENTSWIRTLSWSAQDKTKSKHEISRLFPNIFQKVRFHESTQCWILEIEFGRRSVRVTIGDENELNFLTQRCAFSDAIKIAMHLDFNCPK